MIPAPRNPPIRSAPKGEKHRMIVRPNATRAGLLLLAFALATLAAAPAFAARVSGIGLIDYRKKNFKVGDWVRYRVEVANSNGMEAVNFQELRIAGEENFRGEPCTWVETWFGKDSTSASWDLTLISNEVFKDPQSDVRFSSYARMMMLDTDEEGRPDMTEVKRAGDPNTLPDLTPYRGKVDTLGFDKVETLRGAIEARMVKLTRKLRNPRDIGDSTINKITEVVRTSWISPRVPITSLVQEEEIEDWRIQAYKVGEVSTSAPEVPFSSESRKVTVVDWGTGARSTLLKLWRQKKAETPQVPDSGL
jgi:hypothetical protein